MDFAFHVSGDPDALLAQLCPVGQDGHVIFGFAGRSRRPANHNDLIEGQVEIRDYVMEGFVTYKLSVERGGDGLRFIVRKTGDTSRDKAIDCFVEKYLSADGLAVSKSAV